MALKLRKVASTQHPRLRRPPSHRTAATATTPPASLHPPPPPARHRYPSPPSRPGIPVAPPRRHHHHCQPQPPAAARCAAIRARRETRPARGFQSLHRPTRAIHSPGDNDNQPPQTTDESRRKQLPPTHRLGKGPDFANSSRFHFALFQRQPVNRSTGPRFRACRAVALRRRVHSVPPSQIVEDRQPARGSRTSALAPSAMPPAVRWFHRITFKPDNRSIIQVSLWTDISGEQQRMPRQHMRRLEGIGSFDSTIARQCKPISWLPHCDLTLLGFLELPVPFA